MSFIAELLRDFKPMGDLGQFVIGDLTPDQEDAVFNSLERREASTVIALGRR